ncbi:MAG: nitrous oxide reductase accessory protein NosL [Duodenibacillus sp.]|nr:nitrous oxide reductase accessory protein NosL [Duodenibacillus sp.]
MRYGFILASALAAVAFSAQAAGLPDITDADDCSGCVMHITQWPGPKGQVLHADATTAKYCSVKCMLCNHLAGNPKAQGKLFAHDAGRVTWEKPENGRWIPIEDAWFVHGSSRQATMGKSVAPFTNEAAALAFQKAYGGNVLRLKDFTPQILGCKKKKPAQ